VKGDAHNEIAVIDRKSKKFVNKITFDKEICSSSLWKSEQFDPKVFPYVFIRNLHTLELVDLITNKSYAILKNVEAPNDWVFYLNNYFHADTGVWQFLIN
jgi:hypothetical protein